MNDIQSDRFDRWLRARFALAQGVVAPVVTPEVQPTFDVDRAPRPEDEFLKDNWLWCGRINQIAVALERGQLALRNRSWDRVIVVEEVKGIVESFLSITLAPATLGPVPSQRDSRLALQYTAGELRQGTTLGAAPNTWLETPVGGVWKCTFPWVILPQSSLVVDAVAVNVGVDCGFVWRERNVENAEWR